jgi:hypothetical protein
MNATPVLIQRALALLLAGAVFMLAGCGVIEPWVKPYERERLADPIMKIVALAIGCQNTEHIHEVREGARGANGVQGGGCGCN